MEILKWAESHNLELITEEKFVAAAHPHLSEEQCQTFNREIWGFLSGCLSGQAEVHFKRSVMLNGIDAWRRVVRIIEDTLPMRFEQLRRAAQMIHLKLIKDFESIPNGIAEFETTLEDYESVGGVRSSDQIRKSDLLAILPTKLQSDLLWNSTNPSEAYEQFRDLILTQSARIVDLARRQGRGGVHAVARSDQEDGPPPLGTSAAEDMREDDENNPISSLEELLAMVNRQRTGGSGRPQQRRTQQQEQRRPQAGAAQRPPRKCANCGLEHEQRICPHPPVPREERKCWTCGKGGHASRDCPEKKRGPAIKAIEDQLPFFGANCVIEDSDGYRPARRPARPTPRGITLQDFIKTPTQNRFASMAREDTETGQRSQPTLSKTTTMHRSQPAKSNILAVKPNDIIDAANGSGGLAAWARARASISTTTIG
jgi:hypothetical protein